MGVVLLSEEQRTRQNITHCTENSVWRDESQAANLVRKRRRTTHQQPSHVTCMCTIVWILAFVWCLLFMVAIPCLDYSARNMGSLLPCSRMQLCKPPLCIYVHLKILEMHNSLSFLIHYWGHILCFPINDRLHGS